MSFTTFVGQASTTQYVANDTGGHAVPILMPSGIQAGDYIVCNMGNADGVNVVNPSIAPSGWTLKGQGPDQWVKLADGTESGTTVNWTSNDLTTFSGSFRVWVAIVVCYRFPTVPTLIDNLSGQNFSAVGTSATSGAYDTIVSFPVVRVFTAVGQGDDGSFLAAGNSVPNGFSWNTATDRAGLITLPWDGTGFLGDHTGMVVGDIEHDMPAGAYAVTDNVTFTSPGPAHTAGRIKDLRFHFPTLATVYPYWGILATPG